MIAVDAVKRIILLVNRFGLYLSIPAFLLIAYAYTSSIYPQYRITAKIALKNVTAESAISDIKSKYLVQKALNELSFQASYYDAESPKTEIYGNSLCARLVFAGYRYTNTETWLRLEVQGANSVTLTHGDTSAYNEFNKPVNEFYGKFKIVHNQRAEYQHASYIVRIENPVRLLERYYNSLRVKTTGDDNTITVSVLSGNPKKGADFINKLLQLYDGSQRNIASYRLASTTGTGISAEKFTVLEKPENNAEEASVSPFWIYTIALLAGLFIPLSRKIANRSGTYVLSIDLNNLARNWSIGLIAGLHLSKWIRFINRKVDKKSRYCFQNGLFCREYSNQ